MPNETVNISAQLCMTVIYNFRIQINGQSRFGIENATALTPNSDNLDWSFDVDDKLFKFIVKGKETSRKRRQIEIDDPDYTHVSVKPTVYR